ncbi:MAG: LamB/YcsF family protein, partial [Verrucomicrobiota bacterium]
VEQDPRLGVAYVQAVARWFPRLILYARAGGRVEKLARAAGVPVWPEAFADRGYQADGSLVARGEPGALLASRGAVRERIQEQRRHGWVVAVDGARVPLRVRTWCVHADTPEAVALARAVRESLRP